MFELLAQGIPTDPASLFIYVLLAVGAFLIWKGSRGKKRPGP